MKIKNFLKNEIREFGLLLRNIPALITALFVVCVFSMNLLANKSIDFGIDLIALDCGTLISWFAFLVMDVITKHYGPKAATQISLLAAFVNLVLCLIFFLISLIPGVWSESYVAGSENIINGALNSTFGGTWFVVLGSMTAFIASSVIHNVINWGIGKACKKKSGFGIFILRSYVATAIAQFVDNLIFALIVSYHFFGWSMTQCAMCATICMAFELLFQAIFSPIGYKLTKHWQKNEVGKAYFDFVNSKDSKIASLQQIAR